MSDLYDCNVDYQTVNIGLKQPQYFVAERGNKVLTKCNKDSNSDLDCTG